MSLDHKAYAFDWHSFAGEMLPWLAKALERNDCKRFVSFIHENVEVCSDPYEGQPLDRNWDETVDVTDVQQLADFALTKYYEPSDNHGLSGTWIELDESLPPDLKPALVGQSIVGFDPGRQGSYFWSPMKRRDTRACCKVQSTRRRTNTRDSSRGRQAKEEESMSRFSAALTRRSSGRSKTRVAERTRYAA